MPIIRAALRAHASRVLAVTGLLCLSFALAVVFASSAEGETAASLAHSSIHETRWPRVDANVAAESVAVPAWKGWAEPRAMGDDVFEPASEMRRAALETPPMFYALHGMCGEPAPVCERLVEGTSGLGAMVCHAGNAPCGDAYEWLGEPEERAQYVASRVDETERALAWRGASRVLVGFSRGAFVARDAAYHTSGKYSGLVLIGAAIVPDVELLKKNGIQRVVLASGDFDGARPTMLNARTVLCAKGIPARFVSLGKVWHALPADSGARLAKALAWVAERGEAKDPGCTAERPRT